MKPRSQPINAVLGGTVCLLVLAVMMLLHAWPLWTGEVIVMPVTLSQSRDAFRGERLLVAPSGARIVVGNPATTAHGNDVLVVPPSGDWWRRVPEDARERRRALLARVVYLQLERGKDLEHRPVSIGTAPVRDMVNLRGRIRSVEASGTIEIDYGVDAYYMEQGQANQVQHALKAGSHVQMQLAIARSGRARIKRLSIDGREIS